MGNLYRTHTCGELSIQDTGKTVKLAGWVDRVRNLGHMIFFTLRDHYGRTQVIHHITPNTHLSEKIMALKPESVVFLEGVVKSREKDINPDMPTGEIEIDCKHLEIDSLVDALPFPLNEILPPEDLRLKYRFLDLRRDKLQENIKLRSKIMKEIRDYMYAKGFLEIHTPILTASSPEGARDYVVPSRLHLGKFYALPQAPQQYKQLLMCSGFDKYFQIAPCFRDEDARADRSPGEFYQLDMEMAFATQNEVFETIEGLFHHLTPKVSNKIIQNSPFPHLSYEQVMNDYGTDKPDLRFGLKINNISEIFYQSNFELFAQNTRHDKSVRAIVLHNMANKSRSYFGELEDFVKMKGLKGLSYLKYMGNELSGSISKYLSDIEKEALIHLLDLKENDVILIAAGDSKTILKALGNLRTKIATQEQLIDENLLAFCWIVDFPMFEWNEIEEKIDFAHNPFSMPQGGLEALQTKDPLEILAYQYDIVCNGIEISSGAIRNHRPDIMFKAFDIVGHSEETVLNKFGHMINAFKLGAPPHGGIAPGLDRMAMIYANEPNIREVVAFPLNQQAQELMMNAPSFLEEKQLKELHLKIEDNTGT